MVSRFDTACLLIQLGLFTCLLTTTGCPEWLDNCCHSIPMIESCESNTVVTRDPEGKEHYREECASDEQCLAFTEERAECRLQERCTDPPTPPECRGDDLVFCVTDEHYLSRSSCHERYGQQQGRCEPNTTAGARCVDLDAAPCTIDACDGDDKLLCKDGFTDRSPACTFEWDQAAGGTCRINHEDAPVCGQPAAPRCGPLGYAEHCEGTQIVSCRDGFIWRHDCAEGTSCRLKRYGKTNPTYWPVCQ